MDKRDTAKPNPSAAATGAAAAAAATAQTDAGPIDPTSPDYPPYFIGFSGGSLSGTLPVTGPHTFVLTPPGGGKLTVSLTRNRTDPGRPNLSITFS